MIQCDIFTWKHFAKLIFGIKCKQVVDFDKSTPTVKEERNKTLLHQTKLK